MKKSLSIIIVILVILIAFSLVKNLVAKASVSAGVRAITGLKLSIKSMNVGILRTLIGIKELRLLNPPGFVDELMVDMPEIYVDYDLGAFIKRKVHLEELRLNLKEFYVVKNEKGEINLDSLKVVRAKKEEKAVPEKEKAKMPEFQIDVLELKIGKVVYKDYSRGLPPRVREFNVNINERYENITNPYTFASLIVVKALMNTTIASLANFDLGPLKGEVTETLKKATKITQEAVGKAVEAGKEVGEKAKEAAKEAVEKTTDTIKEILPFGK